MKIVLLIACVVGLAACSQKDNGVRVSAEKPIAKSTTPKPVSRSEPVFYNGKTYRVNLAPGRDGVYNVTVGGMSGGQQKDAVAVATSSVRYFGCPDGKTGKLTGAPSYNEGTWVMSARCG
jgi:hypothetical protein